MTIIIQCPEGSEKSMEYLIEMRIADSGRSTPPTGGALFIEKSPTPPRRRRSGFAQKSPAGIAPARAPRPLLSATRSPAFQATLSPSNRMSGSMVYACKSAEKLPFLLRFQIGGERGVRSLGHPLDSVSYRSHIARNAGNASGAVGPCSFLRAAPLIC
jgi:hypothetical protein